MRGAVAALRCSRPPRAPAGRRLPRGPSVRFRSCLRNSRPPPAAVAQPPPAALPCFTHQWGPSRHSQARRPHVPRRAPRLCGRAPAGAAPPRPARRPGRRRPSDSLPQCTARPLPLTHLALCAPGRRSGPPVLRGPAPRRSSTAVCLTGPLKLQRVAPLCHRRSADDMRGPRPPAARLCAAAAPGARGPWNAPPPAFAARSALPANHCARPKKPTNTCTGCHPRPSRRAPVRPPVRGRRGARAHTPSRRYPEPTAALLGSTPVIQPGDA